MKGQERLLPLLCACLVMALSTMATSSLLLIAACFICLSCVQTNAGELYIQLFRNTCYMLVRKLLCKIFMRRVYCSEVSVIFNRKDRRFSILCQNNLFILLIVNINPENLNGMKYQSCKSSNKVQSLKNYILSLSFLFVCICLMVH